MDKEELNMIIRLDDRVSSKIRQLEQLRETKEGVSGIDYSGTNISSGGTSSQVEETVVKIVEYENEIQEDIKRLIDMKSRASKSINKVKGVYGIILEMRYLECMVWEEIAYRLNYNIRHIHRLHGHALEKIKKY